MKTIYPIMFKAGDVVEVRVTKELLDLVERDSTEKEYRLDLYHKKRVVVVSRVIGYGFAETGPEDFDTHKKVPIVQLNYPDDEGLVQCQLPFPYSFSREYTDNNGRVRRRKVIVTELPILYSNLTHVAGL